MSQYCMQVYLMLYIIIQFSEESVNAYSILPIKAQKNETTEVEGASNILPIILEENETTEVVEKSNISPVISQKNGAAKTLDESNILPDIAQENGTTEHVDASNVLRGVSEENKTTKVVDASNISSGIIEQNAPTEVIDSFNILPGILEENGTAVVHISKVLSGIGQQSVTTKVVKASNILPGISHERGTTIVSAFNILSNILKGNVTTEVVPVSNISSSNAQDNETKEIEGASKYLPGGAQGNGTSKVLDASNILRGIVQEKRTAEAVDIHNILPKQNVEYLPRSCYDLRKLGGVCKDENNKIIESDPTSDVKEVYEITFNDTKFLPARALFGFSIEYLLLNNPDVTVDEKVFEGIVQLNRFYVIRSNIQDIPDFRIVKDTIRTIDISLSPLTSLEGNYLQNLAIVEDLFFVKNSIRFADPDVFKGTDNVVYLDLSYNLLTSIPPNLLDPMKNLLIFSARHNNLLHLGNLFSITHPQMIYLNSNNITDVESLLCFDMDNVTSLDLSRNPITNLTADSFNRKINKVQYLNLSHCELQNFSSEYFVNLKDLHTLDLSYNLIEEDSATYSEIFKDYDYVDKPLLKLMSFSLNGNKLKSLRKILKYKEIFKLSVSENQLLYLTDEDFKFVKWTQNLALQENQIRRIDTDTFKHIRTSLEILDLDYNLITTLNGSISYLSKLKKLYLGDNLIQSFARDEFTGLDELSELYLQYNRIKTLWQFQQLPSLQHLDITHNDIEEIIPDQVPKMLKRIYLAGNPLECDCRLQPFLLRFHTKDSFETDIDICTHYAHKNSNCPGMCSCGCTNFGDDHFISVDCSANSLCVVPQIFRDGFKMVENNKTITSTGHGLLVMKQNIYPSFDLEGRVLVINLENNTLVSLEGIQLPPNLTQLYLANNMLRRLPDSILKNQVNLKNVSLSGNLWSCDCDALKFKRWLTSPQRHGTIQDIESVRCETSGRGKYPLNGKVIWKLNDHDLCPKDENDLTVSSSIGVLTVIILCLAATIMYRKYEFSLKALLYFHGFNFVKEKDFDYDKMFDAFLSFCHQDDTFVIDEIISVIEERDPKIHLCIHHRHFMAGEHINDNIIWAVQNSKRTVLILSKNFLDSEWCLMEFRTALRQSLDDKIHRIIAIKVGDLPKEIDPAIKAYLDTTTYLTWGEKHFWNKLLYILPRGSCVRNRPEDV